MLAIWTPSTGLPSRSVSRTSISFRSYRSRNVGSNWDAMYPVAPVTSTRGRLPELMAAPLCQTGWATAAFMRPRPAREDTRALECPPDQHLDFSPRLLAGEGVGGPRGSRGPMVGWRGSGRMAGWRGPLPWHHPPTKPDMARTTA